MDDGPGGDFSDDDIKAIVGACGAENIPPRLTLHQTTWRFMVQVTEYNRQWLRGQSDRPEWREAWPQVMRLLEIQAELKPHGVTFDPRTGEMTNVELTVSGLFACWKDVD